MLDPAQGTERSHGRETGAIPQPGLDKVSNQMVQMGPSNLTVSQVSLQRQMRMEEKFWRRWSELASNDSSWLLGNISEKSAHGDCRGWGEVLRSSCRARTVTAKFYPSFFRKLTKTQPLTALKSRYGGFLPQSSSSSQHRRTGSCRHSPHGPFGQDAAALLGEQLVLHDA